MDANMGLVEPVPWKVYSSALEVSLCQPYTSNDAGDSSSSLTVLRYAAAIAPSMMR